MNERIKELKKQALEYAMAVHEGHIVPPLDKEVWPIGNVFDEKFAELIVEECIDVVEGDDGASHVRELLSKHFGVEE